eukprot:scaffold18402_cov63-Cyclotella_meneghiniana.AAC.1
MMLYLSGNMRPDFSKWDRVDTQKLIPGYNAAGTGILLRGIPTRIDRRVWSGRPYIPNCCKRRIRHPHVSLVSLRHNRDKKIQYIQVPTRARTRPACHTQGIVHFLQTSDEEVVVRLHPQNRQ